MPSRKRNFEPKKRTPDVPVMQLGEKEHQPPEFVVRMYKCFLCGRAEAEELYEFVAPQKWKCELCWRKDINECKVDTAPKSD